MHASQKGRQTRQAERLPSKMRSAGGTGSPSQQALLEAVSIAVSARQLLVERGIKRVAAVPVVMLGLCYLVTRTDRMRVDPGYACTCCDLCSWQCRGACCVHWLCPTMCSCCGAPCEQPHCLEIYFLSRRCASTRADRHVFARLQPSWLKPRGKTAKATLTLLQSSSYTSHHVASSVFITATHHPNTVLLANPASQR